MKKRQMLLAVILMLSLAFAFAPGSFAKKKAPKLNKTKVTLQVGKNATLKVKNTSKKVTWKSSNKSVATVSKKGVVTAKKEGKATITAKVAGKSLKCKVTVKAKTPVTPTSQTLKYRGAMPYEYDLEREYVGHYTDTQLEQMGYKDVEGQYYYTNSVYVDVPFKINSAAVVAKTTGTKIGAYNGTSRYELDMAGTVTVPTKGYIEKCDWYSDETIEKVAVDFPKDSDSVRNLAELKESIQNRLRIGVTYYNKSTEYKSRDDMGDANAYVMRNLGDTDKEFEGYVSAFNLDVNGNFTYKVFDVSRFEIWDYFSFAGVHIGPKPEV